MRQGTAYTYSAQVHPAYIRRAELLGTGVDDKKKSEKKVPPILSQSHSPVEVHASADLGLPLAAALEDILRGKLGLRGYKK